MDTAKATLVGTVVAALVTLAGALLNRYGKRDDTATERARLAEDRRQKDIDRIIETLQEEIASQRQEVAGLRVVVKSHEQTIIELRAQNYDLFGEKQQLANEVTRQKQRSHEQDRELVTLRARVAQLEGKVS